jgi:hypothetical protein
MTYIYLCYPISVNYMNIQFDMGYALTNYSRKARLFEVGHLSALMGLLRIPCPAMGTPVCMGDRWTICRIDIFGIMNCKRYIRC